MVKLTDTGGHVMLELKMKAKAVIIGKLWIWREKEGDRVLRTLICNDIT